VGLERVNRSGFTGISILHGGNIRDITVYAHGNFIRGRTGYHNKKKLKLPHFSLSWFSCGFSILIEMKLGDVGFCGGRKPENLKKNPRSKARTNNKLNPHMHRARIEPRPHWWEASVLTTAPKFERDYHKNKTYNKGDNNKGGLILSCPTSLLGRLTF